MTKTYKLLIDSAIYPKGTMAEYLEKQEIYHVYKSNTPMANEEQFLEIWQIENRPEVWQLQEEKLDLRSPEAEKMREEARAKRWEFVPNMSLGYYSFILGTKTTCSTYWDWDNDEVDLALWGMGNCHRTKEDALAWGEKYARYFLTE